MSKQSGDEWPGQVRVGGLHGYTQSEESGLAPGRCAVRRAGGENRSNGLASGFATRARRGGGPGRYCSPRHRRPLHCNASNEGSKCASMAWWGVSDRPYPDEGGRMGGLNSPASVLPPAMGEEERSVSGAPGRRRRRRHRLVSAQREKAMQCNWVLFVALSSGSTGGDVVLAWQIHWVQRKTRWKRCATQSSQGEGIEA
jgi:hypothetical protein